MLTLEGVVAGYGESQVLNGIGFGVGAAQVVTLLGRNGMGSPEQRGRRVPIAHTIGLPA